MEFTYKGKIYNISRYPIEAAKLKRKFSKIVGKDLFQYNYEVALIDSKLPQV